MRTIIGFGKNVICEAPAAQRVESKMVGGASKGFGVIANKEQIVPLKVLFDDFSNDLHAGSVVYIRQERLTGSIWGKPLEVDLGGEKKTVVAIPVDEILMVEVEEQDEA